jgi:hypothetical protein
VFTAPDAALRHRQRTLLQQELLAGGISIYNNGVMLPCFAHDAATLAETLDVFGVAMQLVADATREGTIDRRIHIPLLADM